MKKGDSLNLPKGWEKVLLKDICKVFVDGDWIESKDQSQEGIRLVQTGNIGFGYFKDKEDKSRFISEETFQRLKCTEILAGDLLVSRLPDPVGKSCIIPEINSKMITGVDCTIIRPKDNLSSLFLCYYQMSNKYLKDVQLGVSGATRQRISRKNLGQIEIPLPPLPEQQQIVSIIDEAFAAIAIAKANAEQNLKNAKELFESYLQGVFENKGEDWEEQVLEDCFKMKSGDNLTAKNMIEGSYPVFGGNGIAGYHNKYNLSGSNVIIGRVGALCGNVRHINENIWLTDNAFKLVDLNFDFDQSFLTYLLNYKDLRSYARQAAQPVISNSSLKDVVLNFPKTKEEQQKIVRQLDALKAETKKLEAIYHQKINDLEELKKSVLQKAFSGELETKKEIL